MSFLNPIMLFGLAAVSVPIIIHLLNRRRFQKVVWAAMKFLQVSVEQNQRRMRIEDMILLALRCLLLALLALALAPSAILSKKGDVFGQSKVTGVMILEILQRGLKRRHLDSLRESPQGGRAGVGFHAHWFGHRRLPCF